MTTPALATASFTPVLEGRNLEFAPGGQRVFYIPSCSIPPGVTWLRGGEGRGKTSLLRLLAGEITSPHGALQIADSTLSAQPASYRQQVAWFDPKTSAFDQFTVQDFYNTRAQRCANWDAALLASLTDALALAPHLHKPLAILSTGTKRKVWLSAALASGTTLTLLDEPFAALDKASIGCVLDFLSEAASHTTRAWVVADYVAPAGVPLAHTIDLGE